MIPVTGREIYAGNRKASRNGCDVLWEGSISPSVTTSPVLLHNHPDSSDWDHREPAHSIEPLFQSVSFRRATTRPCLACFGMASALRRSAPERAGPVNRSLRSILISPFGASKYSGRLVERTILTSSGENRDLAKPALPWVCQKATISESLGFGILKVTVS